MDRSTSRINQTPENQAEQDPNHPEWESERTKAIKNRRKIVRETETHALDQIQAKIKADSNFQPCFYQPPYPEVVKNQDLFYTLCFKYHTDDYLKVSDLERYLTELIRLPKQPEDDPRLLRHIVQCHAILDKYQTDGKVSLTQFKDFMSGYKISKEDQDYTMTDDEAYKHLLRRFFKYASGTADAVIDEEELKYFLLNQLRVARFSQQEFDLVFKSCFEGKEITQDKFIEYCKYGMNSTADVIIEQEKILMETGQSEVLMQNPLKRLSRNPNHFGDLLATEPGDRVKEGAARKRDATIASAYNSSTKYNEEENDPKYMTEI